MVNQNEVLELLMTKVKMYRDVGIMFYELGDRGTAEDVFIGALRRLRLSREMIQGRENPETFYKKVNKLIVGFAGVGDNFLQGGNIAFARNLFSEILSLSSAILESLESIPSTSLDPTTLSKTYFNTGVLSMKMGHMSEDFDEKEYKFSNAIEAFVQTINVQSYTGGKPTAGVYRLIGRTYLNLATLRRRQYPTLGLELCESENALTSFRRMEEVTWNPYGIIRAFEGQVAALLNMAIFSRNNLEEAVEVIFVKAPRRLMIRDGLVLGPFLMKDDTFEEAASAVPRPHSVVPQQQFGRSFIRKLSDIFIEGRTDEEIENVQQSFRIVENIAREKRYLVEE